MNGKITTELGIVHYTDEVLGNIVGLSTMECYGVVGMASKNAKDGFWELLRKENLNKGVKIHTKDDQLNVQLFIIVEYGIKISVIANSIIQKVKYTIENLTGLKVACITVNVQGVRV